MSSVQKVTSKKRKKKNVVLSNQTEYSSFLKTAFAWKGSVAPKILPRVAFAALYTALIVLFMHYFPDCELEIAPFEYTGAVLGVLLVLRVNAGMDRWWEARKIWGNIVNQSRNLAIIIAEYADQKDERIQELLNWIALWPYTMRDQLREVRNPDAYRKFIDLENAQKLANASHMPMFIGLKIASLLKELRKHGLDDFSFHRAECERSILIDMIGASERIKNTPLPFILAVITRRFIFLYLLLLPLAFTSEQLWLGPLVMALTSYPLFSLDEIGIELQNPFSTKNLSHLPLNEICDKIAADIFSVMDDAKKINIETSHLP